MKKRQLYILIVLLVIGFASVTTSLIINGNLKIGFNSDDYDVIFIEALLDGKESTNAIINDDRKTITFTTDKLINIGDSARLDYKVKNISNQYDADVKINCSMDNNEYISLSSYFDGYSLPLSSPINIKAQEVKNGYINIELAKVYAGEDTSIEITCKLDFSASSREEYAYSLIFDSNGGSNVEDKSINFNDAYGDLEEPIREGYIFLGWFDENDVKVDNSTVMNSKGNRNLHAKWSSNLYKVELKKVYPDKTESSEINIPYGESIDTLITVGDKYYIDNIECSDGYSISNFDKNNAIYNEHTIKINNEKVTKEGVCTFTILQGVYEYSYTGSEQEFIVPLDGNYKIELWGAANLYEKLGSYTSGEIELTKEEKYYIYIGGIGSNSTIYGSYNGGGNVTKNALGSHGITGSGATDIRLKNGSWNNFDSLKSRIMVSAGAGSTSAPGGGLVGYDEGNSYTFYAHAGKAAMQTSGGKSPTFDSCATTNGTAGGFGFGGIGGANASGSTAGGGCGGGSGYYGGSGGSGICNGNMPSGSGSSFISGHNGCDAIAENSTSSSIKHTGQPNHYSGLVFTNTIMIDGAGYNWTNVKGEQVGVPTHDGKSIMTGNTNNGYAKITYLGK